MANETERSVNVILGDGNPLVLSAMAEIIERDPRFALIATSSTAEGFLGTVMRLPVEIGVIDWNLPVLGGARLIDVLREQGLPTRIIVYGDDTGDLPRLAMSAGAAGFAPRSGEIGGLLSICIDVAKGKMVFPFVDVRGLQQHPIQSLSRKERQILEALATGLSNKELSRELDISPNTVKFHLSNVYEKLAVRNRAQAIAYFYSSRAAGLSAADRD